MNMKILKHLLLRRSQLLFLRKALLKNNDDIILIKPTKFPFLISLNLLLINIKRNLFKINT
jgi:hypothetical protein